MDKGIVEDGEGWKETLPLPPQQPLKFSFYLCAFNCGKFLILPKVREIIQLVILVLYYLVSSITLEESEVSFLTFTKKERREEEGKREVGRRKKSKITVYLTL